MYRCIRCREIFVDIEYTMCDVCNFITEQQAIRARQIVNKLEMRELDDVLDQIYQQTPKQENNNDK